MLNACRRDLPQAVMCSLWSTTKEGLRYYKVDWYLVLGHLVFGTWYKWNTTKVDRYLILGTLYWWTVWTNDFNIINSRIWQVCSFDPTFCTGTEDWILLLLHHSLRKGEHFDRRKNWLISQTHFRTSWIQRTFATTFRCITSGVRLTKTTPGWNKSECD